MSRERLRVFVSSKMSELADERRLIKNALKQLEIDAWVFEADAGARPSSIRDTYLDELGDADIYIGLFWKGYGEYTIDEFNNARKQSKPCLIYEKRTEVDQRDPRLQEFLDEISAVESGLTIRWFQDQKQLSQFIRQDIADLLAEAFRSSGGFSSIIFQVPHRRNPRFIGREHEIEKLSSLLDENTSEVRVFVLAGLGGIGKTQLAVEFAYLHRNRFPGGVFWLNMADESDINRQVANCAGPGGLDLPDNESKSFPDRIAAVKQAWQQPILRLLVFDNCESETLIGNWCPPVGGCIILVTSLSVRWDPTLVTQVLSLEVLSRSESISLLKSNQEFFQGEEKDLDAIAAELGDLPLALYQASNFLARYRRAITPAKYLAQLKSMPLLQHQSLQPYMPRTLQMSYSRLKVDNVTDAQAIALLARAACFVPGVPILRYMLYLARPRTADETDGNSAIRPSIEDIAHRMAESVFGRLERRTDQEFEDALIRLLELGLIESLDDNAIQMQPLVVAFVEEYVPDNEALADVWGMLYREWTGSDHRGNIQPKLYFQNWRDPDQPDYDFLPHLRHVISTGLARGDWWALDAARGLAHGLRSIGDYAGARTYLERTLDFCQRVPQANEKIGRSANDLALLLQAQGDFDNARKYFEQALQFREHELGPDHPLLGTVLSNIGVLLHQQGDLDGSYQYLKRALAIRKQPVDMSDSVPASIMNDLGMLLWDRGDLRGAQDYFQRALKYCEDMFAGFHPVAALSAHYLGRLLQKHSDIVGARENFNHALEISEKVHGADTSETAYVLTDIGELLRDQGDIVGAREYLQRALGIFEQKLLPNHPQTLLVRAQLMALDSSEKTDTKIMNGSDQKRPGAN